MLEIILLIYKSRSCLYLQRLSLVDSHSDCLHHVRCQSDIYGFTVTVASTAASSAAQSHAACNSSKG